jgi:hypothetical protein
MFEVEMTINGKPATEANIENEIDRAVFDAVISGLRETITSTITPAEARQISIDFQGNNIQSLSANISGPDEIVKKVEAALAN